jgi:1,4-alpha-glucan branching enzyme
VAVAGSFNSFSPSAAPLAREPSGYWSTDVPGAKLGDEYKFLLTGPNRPGTFWKNDPYCRWLTNSIGNGIVAETQYEYVTTGYSTPPVNELVIYELHVGSFLFNAGSQNGRGNFDSVISKLGYLRGLGINAIQIMPSDEFPGDIS